jgi:O-antigen ligase
MTAAVPAPLARIAMTVLVVLPWLWPFTPGPSTNAVPLLVAWTCIACALLLQALTGARIAQAAPAGWLVAALLSACIALAQWAGIAPDTPLVSSAAIGEAYANLRQRNQFATLTSVGIAVAVWCVARIGARRAVAAIALLAIAKAATASRTGFFELLLLAGLAAAWPGPRRHRLVLVAAAIAVHIAASLVLPWLLFEWRGLSTADVFRRTVADLGCHSRRVLWSNVVSLILERPWLGWGPGELDYAHFVTLYDGVRFCDILDNAHNLPLHVAVELGLPLALGLFTALGTLLWRARPWREQDGSRQLAWAALAMLAFHSLLEYPLWYGPFQALLLQGVAMLLPPMHGHAAAWRRASIGFAAVVLLAVVIAGQSYSRVTQAYLQPEQRRAAYRVDPVRAAEGVWLFETQRRFAELAITPLSRENAARVNELATELLHYSPEPAVVEKLIDSSLLLGRPEDAAWYAVRYRAAFPDRYQRWMSAGGLRRQP